MNLRNDDPVKDETSIFRFAAEFRFLSNFYGVPPGTIFLPDEPPVLSYPSVEHAFQAAKTLQPPVRQTIRSCATATEAKQLGRSVKLRADWESVRDAIMLHLLRHKFGARSALRAALKRTTPLTLIEGNTWGDTYWGVCDGVGENKLGKLLMQVRSEIRQADGDDPPNS
jgi:ribA/ribD-fused uncharacterized protein